MAGLPGSIPSMMPAGADELVRRMRDLERRMDEMGPSVSKSFLPMLATVVQGGQAGTWTVNFAVPITGTAVASVSIAVPDGYANAIVFATAHASAMNTGAGNDYLYVGASINSVAPSYLLAPIGPSGGYATSSGSASRILTGLSGGVITLDAMVHSEFAPWTATGSNHASIDAIAIFYR